MLSKQELVSANKKSCSLFIFFLFILSINISLAQTKDSLYYFIPASIKIKALDYINISKSNHSSYGVLSHQNDTTLLLISRYGDSPKELTYLIKNSNRYLKLSSTEVIPILLREDFLFSNILHSVKKEGNPYAIYTHNSINISGYSITYQGLYSKVRIIKAEYYQQ